MPETLKRIFGRYQLCVPGSQVLTTLPSYSQRVVVYQNPPKPGDKSLEPFHFPKLCLTLTFGFSSFLPYLQITLTHTQQLPLDLIHK